MFSMGYVTRSSDSGGCLVPSPNEIALEHTRRAIHSLDTGSRAVDDSGGGIRREIADQLIAARGYLQAAENQLKAELGL